MSHQRRVIADAVHDRPVAFTVEELHRDVTARDPGIGLATVYRALAAMQEAGSVVEVGERSGAALLARCDRHDHHHHLVCTKCGGVVPVDCPLGAEAITAATRAGHTVTRHEFTLYGLCAGCARGPEAD